MSKQALLAGKISTDTPQVGTIGRIPGAPLSTLEVKPQEHQQVSLGRFSETDHVKGFSIELSPDPEPTGSIATHIVSLGTPKTYELILHIVNSGDHAVTATISSVV